MNSSDQVYAKGSNGALGQVPILGNESGQATPSAQLYHQPQVVTGLIPFIKLHNIGVADVMSHSYLKKTNHKILNFTNEKREGIYILKKSTCI